MTNIPPPPPFPPAPPPPPGGGYGGGMGNTPWGPPPLAGLGPRIAAFLIDWFAAYLVLGLVFTVLAGVLAAISDVLGVIASLGVFVAYLGFWLWQVYQEGTTGQTIGKRLLNVRLVGLENGGNPVGFGLALARNLINGLCGIFWLFPFFDAQRQTLGDKVSKSIVVPA